MNSSLFRLISHSNRASSQRNHLFVALHSNFFSFSTKPKTPKTQSLTPKTTTPKTEWAKPSEIPFQAKVANLANLIGFVHSPVQFQTTSDGSSWAATVITQNVSSPDDCDNAHQSPDSLPLWVPVIFEGDMAHVAACHIKQNDCVYVSGQLSASLPHVNGSQVQASVLIVVRDINFIEKSIKMKTGLPNVIIKSKEVIANISDSAGKKKDAASDPWKDLIGNPKEWYDYREAKKYCWVSPNFPDFKRKDDSHPLWINKMPKSLLKELQGLEFDVDILKQKTVMQSKESDDLTTMSWKDLINKTKEWRDYRKQKLNGQVNPKYPDFKRKDGSGLGLWLDTAPQWVLSKFEGLEFNDVQIEPNDAKLDHLWKDLVDNPDHWWDNRVEKHKPSYPDFKNKLTGEGLWLSLSPTWVSSKLSAPNESDDPTTMSWKDLINKTKEWRDYRKQKLNGQVNPKYPDFKCKDGSGLGLWLNTAPQWILSKLEGLEFDDVQIEPNDAKLNHLWKDLVDNPDHWWDNRVDKAKPSSPDFKNKRTGEGLWLSSSPTWVSSKLSAPNGRRDTTTSKYKIDLGL